MGRSGCAGRHDPAWAPGAAPGTAPGACPGVCCSARAASSMSWLMRTVRALNSSPWLGRGEPEVGGWVASWSDMRSLSVEYSITLSRICAGRHTGTPIGQRRTLRPQGRFAGSAGRWEASGPPRRVLRQRRSPGTLLRTGALVVAEMGRFELPRGFHPNLLSREAH